MTSVHFDNFLSRFQQAADRAGIPQSSRPLLVGIDSMSLLNNATQLSKRVAGDGLCAVLKGDAYGHGIENVVPHIKDYCTHYAVVDNGEAQLIRDLGIDTPIIRIRPGGHLEVRDGILKGLSIREHVGSVQRCNALSKIAADCDAIMDVHLSLDASGLGRSGLDITNEAMVLDTVLEIMNISQIRLASIGCHLLLDFHDDEDSPFNTLKALGRFKRLALQICQIVHSRYGFVPEVSSSSSATLAALPIEVFHMGNGIPHFHRIGNSLYGLSSSLRYKEKGIRQVMHVATQVCDTAWRKGGSTIGYERTYMVPDPGEYLSTLGVGWSSLSRELQGLGKTDMPAYVASTEATLHPLVGRQSMNISTVRSRSDDHTLSMGDLVFFTTADDIWPEALSGHIEIEHIAHRAGGVQNEFLTSTFGLSSSAIRFTF